MAESENNKPKTEKTSASVTSTLPRLCPNTNLNLKDTSCNIPKLRNRFLGSKPILNDKQKNIRNKENLQENLKKPKLTGFNNSDLKSPGENGAILHSSLKNYHGQIPVHYRHFLNIFKMSPIATRSQSPLKKASPKEKLTNKVKIITLHQDTKKKSNAITSRSLSPLKAAANNVKTKSRGSTSSTTGNSLPNSEKVVESKRIDAKRQRSTKTNAKAIKSKEKSGKDLKTLNKNKNNSIILKQISQPSLSINDKIQPQEKISLDHLKTQVYAGDHTRLSIAKVHLCIEKSIDNLSLKEKNSYFITYSSEDTRKQEETDLSFLQNISSTSFTTCSTESNKKKKVKDSQSAIKTLSGQELILTPSMKLDIEKEDAASEDLKISEILHETIENSEDQKEVLIPQDDANEYDSEVSTDGEMAIQGVSILPSRASSSAGSDVHRKNALWKSREAELLSDVDYRQSVYHPAVSRRHKKDNADTEFRTKSKMMEDNFSDKTKQSSEGQNHSSTKKSAFTCTPPKNLDMNSDKRHWISSFDKTNEKPMYNSVIPAGSFYGVKRIRTKKERVSAGLLHFSLKMIRLLAIFNLWPGDNCHMLTSQSLRFAS